MAVDTDDTADVTPTVTLARLYEEQGFFDKAADIYRRLIALGQADLQEALNDIKRRLKIETAEESETETILSQLSGWQRAIHSRKKILNQRREKGKKILVIHGFNPGIDDQIEPSLSGDVALDQINIEIKRTAQECRMHVDTFQSNDEGELVQKIGESSDGYDVVIINAGQYSYTSVAIREALSMLEIPIIEVHLSNTYGQEAFSQKSLIADVATAHLAGFGKEGYLMAVRAARNMIEALDDGRDIQA